MAYTTAISSAVYGDFLHQCVACGETKINFWRKKDFHYTEGANHQGLDIYRCASCGTGFLNRPPHARWLRSIYQYSGQALTQAITLEEVLAQEAAFPNCKLDAERMSRAADEFNQSDNHRALDIGSGFGFYTHALRKQGYRTVSINPGQYENTVFKKMNGDEPLAVLFENYESAESFGIVMMSQVLEHLLEPERAIRKVSGLLDKNGILACAVPNYESFLVRLLGTRDNACLWVPEHVNYFTQKGLKTLLEKNGLKVVRMEQVTRIPFNALSRRLRLKGILAAIADKSVELLQTPFIRLMNVFGMGIYINVYAIRMD